MRNPIKFQDLQNSVGETTMFTYNFRNEEGKLLNSQALLPESLTKSHKKYPMVSEKYTLRFERDISEDITNLKMTMMPGFILSWRYEPSVESQSHFGTNNYPNEEFIR